MKLYRAQYWNFTAD